MHVTYIYAAVLFVTGLINNLLKKYLIFSRLSSRSLGTAVNMYLPLTSGLSALNGFNERCHYGIWSIDLHIPI